MEKADCLTRHRLSPLLAVQISSAKHYPCKHYLCHGVFTPFIYNNRKRADTIHLKLICIFH